MDNRIIVKITQGTTISLRRILRLLNDGRERNQSSIQDECNLGLSRVRDNLEFLMEVGLIKRQRSKKGIYLYSKRTNKNI